MAKQSYLRILSGLCLFNRKESDPIIHKKSCLSSFLELHQEMVAYGLVCNDIPDCLRKHLGN